MKRWLVTILLISVAKLMLAQTVCAYKVGHEIYLVTYRKTITATIKPNPTDGWIVVALSDVRLSDHYSISIYDPLRLVSYNIIDQNTPIDCTGLAPGVYNYLIKNKGLVVTQGKFVVQ